MCWNFAKKNKQDKVALYLEGKEATKIWLYYVYSLVRHLNLWINLYLNIKHKVLLSHQTVIINQYQYGDMAQFESWPLKTSSTNPFFYHYSSLLDTQQMIHIVPDSVFPSVIRSILGSPPFKSFINYIYIFKSNY